MTDRQPLTNLCNCKAEHWQPHVESCLAYKPRPLLTLENIRSGAFPSDAHAVGFLLGEIELLRDQRDTNLAKEVERIDSLTAQRDHWLEIAREKAAEIERLQFELKAARAELEIADAHIAAKVTAHEPLPVGQEPARPYAWFRIEAGEVIFAQGDWPPPEPDDTAWLPLYTVAARSKFDLAFDIMRQMQAENMDTMQSVHFGYVLRVERGASRDASSGETNYILGCANCGRKYFADGAPACDCRSARTGE